MSQKIFIALCLFDVIQSIVHLLPSIVYRWPLFVSLLVHARSSFKQVFTNLIAQKMFLSYPLFSYSEKSVLSRAFCDIHEIAWQFWISLLWSVTQSIVYRLSSIVYCLSLIFYHLSFTVSRLPRKCGKSKKGNIRCGRVGHHWGSEDHPLNVLGLGKVCFLLGGSGSGYFRNFLREKSWPFHSPEWISAWPFTNTFTKTSDPTPTSSKTKRSGSENN